MEVDITSKDDLLAKRCCNEPPGNCRKMPGSPIGIPKLLTSESGPLPPNQYNSKHRAAVGSKSAVRYLKDAVVIQAVLLHLFSCS